VEAQFQNVEAPLMQDHAADNVYKSAEGRSLKGNQNQQADNSEFVVIKIEQSERESN